MVFIMEIEMTNTLGIDVSNKHLDVVLLTLLDLLRLGVGGFLHFLSVDWGLAA